ncbi:Monoacylglycerol lipase ABHD2 [Hondaea fermentalgiana]|uniref:Monoacylglycerol lipase ABHD2 n=1 Tax=Hondaea fermentalgiana TaxID=2315210 RepID=A0A2R5GT58_9STRA|nr:Monoacylglycerol lipase ABHD2 [Hondaea fermentalgiana]|eukprot:GBG31064.1 Monoacylglycerol lipase ABHD2 [Hondaea fermentalgiana]
MLAVVVLAVCVDAALRRRTSKAWRDARGAGGAAEGAALFAEEEGLGRGAGDAPAASSAAGRSRAHSRNAFSPRSYLGRLGKLLGDDEISHRRVGLAVATSAAGLAAARAASRKFEHVPYADEMTAAGNRVSYYRSANNQRVADALRSLEAYATPTFYNKHLMTGAPILRIDDDDLLFQRHVLSARLDGHLVEVAADTLASPRASLDSPSFIVVPGFGGSSEKNLYRILAKSIAERFNAHVHILHERGEGGVPLRSHKLHKMDTRMLEALIEKVRADRGMQVPLFGLGLSQGGSLLLKYIQGFAAPGSPPCPFAAVMTVGCTFQYQVGLQLMEVNGLVGRCYSYILAKMHIDILRRNKEVLDNLDNVDIGEIATCSNLSDLDRKLANPVYGHHSVVAYHDSFNLVEQAHNINIPVLCLHSEDDPLFSDDTHRIQRAAARCSDRIVFFSVPRGGHLSFCERGTRSTYVTRVADRFFKTLLQQQRPVDGQ